MTYRPLPIILDTDFSADVGDLGAVAVACALHKLNYIDLKAVIVCTSNTKSPGAVDAVLNYWGLSGTVPVGCWKGTSFDPSSGTWPGYIYDNYTHPTVTGLASTVQDGKTLMRTVLAARNGADVTIVAVGPLNAVQELMNSTSDGASALSGSDLISASVHNLYVMGGKYPTTGTAEWNFEQHPTSANDVCDNWPTTIYFCGNEVGSGVLNGTTLASVKSSGNLLRAAYDDAGYASGRTAWDEMTIIAAARRNSAFTLTRGTNAVNSSTGVNTFTASTSGPHYYLTKVQADNVYQTFLDSLTAADETATPILSTFPTSAQWLNMASV